jgi:hypothetical protein
MLLSAHICRTRPDRHSPNLPEQAGVRSDGRDVRVRLSSVMACYDGTMPRPNLRDYFGNFSSSDLPLLEKLRLVAKNNAIKIKNGTSCCGNHGEPGC